MQLIPDHFSITLKWSFFMFISFLFQKSFLLSLTKEKLMDELAEIKEMINTFRETLTFLVEQEKIRGEEVSALNDKIEAVNSTLVNQIINPSIEAYKDQQFKDFDEKYGEKLNQFDDTIKLAQNDPEYSSSRAAWDQMNEEVPPEEMESFDTEGYVNQVADSLAEYVDGIKSSLGLAEDTPVEIKQDENGNVDVKADVDGDGKMEEVETEETVETSEEPAPETEEEEEEVDPELQKELDDWASK